MVETELHLDFEGKVDGFQEIAGERNSIQGKRKGIRKSPGCNELGLHGGPLRAQDSEDFRDMRLQSWGEKALLAWLSDGNTC